MKLVIVGTGYVGLVTGACLADVGHSVACVDNDGIKVSRLQKGAVDIYEPGLESLVASNISSKHLTFTSDLSEALKGAAAVFIAVGTPQSEDGSTNLSSVLSVASDIGKHLHENLLVVVKSTVPPGTCNKVLAIINEELSKRHLSIQLDIVSNPEFLKEGSAIADFSRPDRIIVGTDSVLAIQVMRDIYAPYNRNHDKIITMDTVSSELTKYAANAMLATKISFINEIAKIAEKVGADIESVRRGIGSDPRIGYDFIYAGCGYGGSCFPKDIKSLINSAQVHGHTTKLLNAVDEVNELQKNVLYQHLQHHFKNDLKNKIIAIWGLAFKPNTNDIREAPSRILMERLWAAGVTIKAYDPVAMPAIAAAYGSRSDLILVDAKEAALSNADALVICTEWKEFKILDCPLLRSQLKQPVIIDGRNLYDPIKMKQEGFVYYGIGRGASLLVAGKN